MPFGLSSNRRSRNDIDIGKITKNIPDTMKAVVVREHGGLDILKYEDSSWAVPKRLDKGQVLIKNEYAGLNFIDVYYRSGLYTKELPFILGQEGGGIVVKKHRSVIDFEIGDKVVYLASGTYCEYTKVSEDKLIKVPNQLTVEAAICCMIQGLTAHYLTTDALAGHTRKGDWMLIFSVTSGTGQWAAQMAKIHGYKVIGTTSETKKDILPEDWIDEMIVLSTLDGKVCSDYESVDFVDIIMEITDGEGVQCILDGIGKSTADISIDSLSKRGLWLSYGTASGPVPPINLFKLTKKSAYCACPKLGDYISTKDQFRKRAQEVFEYVILGDLNIRVDLIVPLENAREGHAYLEGGRSKGKVLFQCDNPIEEEGDGNNNNNTGTSNGIVKKYSSNNFTTTTSLQQQQQQEQQSTSRFASFFSRRRNRQNNNNNQPEETISATTANNNNNNNEEEEAIEEVNFSPTNYMSPEIAEKVDGDII